MERRRFPRLEVTIVPDEFYPIGGVEIFQKKGSIVNISCGGAAVDTKEPFRRGDNIYLSFRLPTSEKLDEIYGHIIRVIEKADGSMVGIRFITISDDDRKKIDDFVKSELKKKESERIIDVNEKTPAPAAAGYAFPRRKRKEVEIYKTAFRKPRRNREFLECWIGGMTGEELKNKFGMTESGVSMLKKRLMQRDASFSRMRKRFGKFDVKKYRREQGWTQEELAKKIGVRRETVTRWETRAFKPTPLFQWKLMKLAKEGKD